MASCSKELSFDVGYGNLSAKMWGENLDTSEKFLAVHGWLDNAGSFDPLMQHFLSKGRCVVCIDIAGHGLSSHHPKGVPYTPASDVMSMRSVIKHLGWTAYNLIGHSLGAMRCHQYALSWSTEVQSVILLDGIVMPLEINSGQYGRDYTPYFAYGKQADKYIKFTMEYHGKNRQHTWEELKERWLTATPGLTSDDFTILMKRGSNQLDNGMYVYTRDPAHHNRQNILLMLTQTSIIEASRNNPCHFLLIRASKSYVTSSKLREYQDSVLNSCKNQGAVVTVDGTHHFHMQIPEETSDHINAFLDKVKEQVASESNS